MRKNYDLVDNGSYQIGIIVYICICNAITQRQVEECARAGASSVDELSIKLGLGSGCGRCRECATDLLRGVIGCSETAPFAAGSK